MSLVHSPSLGSLPAVQRLFKQSVEWLLEHVPAERAVLLFGEGEEPRVREARGLELENFWLSAPLSLRVLRQVQERAQPLLVSDVKASSEHEDHLSLLLNGVLSLACVPFWGPSGELTGLLYADSRRTAGSLTREHLDQILKLARALEHRLRQAAAGEPLPASPFRELEARGPATPPARPLKPPAYESRLSPSRLKAPSPRARLVFFRSLAGMVSAGVPIHRALSLLGREPEDQAMGEVALELARRIERGQALSQAMAGVEGAFPAFHVQLIAVGERTGRLDRILARLATYEEKRHRDRLRLQSALTYPALVLAATLLLLVVAPGYMLRGQLELLRDLGVAMPLVTRGLWTLTRVASSPLCWLAGAGLASGLAVLARARRDQVRKTLARAALRVPGLGRLVRLEAVLAFARTLGIQLEAGLNVAEALPQAAAVVDHPALSEHVRAARDSLLDGHSLSASLALTGFFPGSFVELIKVAEESGQVPHLVLWLADFHEMELEAALASLTSLLEPAALLIMGIVTGLVTLATMLPMVAALQKVTL